MAAFGNALLSRLPLRVVKCDFLPHVPAGASWLPGWREPRVACWAAVTGDDGREVQVLATHLGLHRRERLAQVDALLGPDWLGSARARVPHLLCGDLNCRPGSPEHRLLESSLVDAVLVAPPRGGRAGTYPARRPLVRLDHVLVSPELRVRRTEIVRGPETRRASDHLPLLAELELPPLH
jgi:endonuclease/exonuclease/phosphatase family metal-dependent hydrolase